MLCASLASSPRLTPSSLYSGTVVKHLDFGVFVSFDLKDVDETLDGTLDGLLHVNAIRTGSFDNNSNNGGGGGGGGGGHDSNAHYGGSHQHQQQPSLPAIGDKITFRVQWVDAETGRISLSTLPVENEGGAAAEGSSRNNGNGNNNGGGGNSNYNNNGNYNNGNNNNGNSGAGGGGAGPGGARTFRAPRQQGGGGERSADSFRGNGGGGVRDAGGGRRNDGPSSSSSEEGVGNGGYIPGSGQMTGGGFSGSDEERVRKPEPRWDPKDMGDPNWRSNLSNLDQVDLANYAVVVEDKPRFLNA